MEPEKWRILHFKLSFSEARTHLLDVVIAQRATIFQLLAREDEPLLVRRDSLLVLDLALYIVDGIARLHLEGDSLARQGLHEAVMRNRQLAEGRRQGAF